MDWEEIMEKLNVDWLERNKEETALQDGLGRNSNNKGIELETFMTTKSIFKIQDLRMNYVNKKIQSSKINS